MSKPESAPDPVRDHRPQSGDVIKLSELLQGRDGEEADQAASAPEEVTQAVGAAVPEIGGRKNGLDPTRYGDWEKDGRCIDF